MGSHRARTCSMKLLLVCTAIASASAAPQLLGYPYSLGAAYPYPLGAAYPYAANIVKPVVKEIEVPVPTIKYVAGESDCKNSFGAPVPCARRRRDADDEEAAEAPVVAPAVLPYGLPLGYPYATTYGLPYTVAAPVQVCPRGQGGGAPPCLPQCLWVACPLCCIS